MYGGGRGGGEGGYGGRGGWGWGWQGGGDGMHSAYYCDKHGGLCACIHSVHMSVDVLYACAFHARTHVYTCRHKDSQ